MVRRASTGVNARVRTLKIKMDDKSFYVLTKLSEKLSYKRETIIELALEQYLEPHLLTWLPQVQEMTEEKWEPDESSP